jgi:vitamin B12 transporter
MWRVFTVVSLVLFPLSGRGQEEAELGTVVVTATRTETPLKEVSTSVTVITEEEIRQQQAETVAEMLRGVPGLDVAQSGSRGTTTSVFIRGAESDQTLVLIDGVEVNSVTLGSFDFANLTTDNIDRIEILRGSGGTLYGSQAVGGVINIITKKGMGKPTASVSAEGGNGSTHREVATFSGSLGKMGFSGSAAYVETDGFRPVNDDYRNLTASLRTDITPLEGGTLRGFFRYAGTEVGLFNSNNFASVRDPDAHQKADFLLCKGEWEHEPVENLIYRVSGSYVRDNLRFFDEPDQFDTSSSVSRIPTEITTGEFQGSYYWRDLSVTTFGFEFEERAADVRTSFGGFLTRFDESRNNFAYYLQEQLRLLNEKFFIVGGFRVDDNEDFGTEVSAAWSIAYLIKKTGTKLKAGFAEGFKAPAFNELFFPNFGNPDLGAETSSEWNAGFEQTLWGERFSLEAIYFNRRVKGLIEAVLVDPQTFTFQAQNLGRVDIEGVEVIPVFRLLPGLSVAAHFTFLDFATRNDRLLRRPEEKGNVILNYFKEGVYQEADAMNINLVVNVMGGRDDVDPVFGPRTNPMYARTDFATSYTFSTKLFSLSRLTIYGKVENLFDRNYEEVLGFKSPPINFLAGIRGTF